MTLNVIWQYLDLNAGETDGDIYLNACWEAGASGVEEDVPLPGWYRVYFPDIHAVRRARKRLKAVKSEGKEPLAVTHGTVKDPGWRSAWHRFFKPTPIGNKFLILPSWETSSDRTRIPLCIHPGQAFGTGYHETTALCLEHIENENFAARSILDAGCGSGVLGIAAAKLGASSVIGVDIESDAVNEAVHNAELNHVSDRCQWIAGLVENLPGTFDCLLGNLHTGFLINHYRVLLDKVRPEGKLIISGFLVTDAETVIGMILKSGFAQILSVTQRGEWSSALVLRTG